MKRIPEQLPLIPQLREVPAGSDRYYMLAYSVDNYDEAQAIAELVRDKGTSVRVTKDRNGEYDEPGNYLLWIRLAKDTVRFFKAVGIITKVMVKAVMDCGRP